MVRMLLMRSVECTVKRVSSGDMWSAASSLLSVF